MPKSVVKILNFGRIMIVIEAWKPTLLVLENSRMVALLFFFKFYF